MFTVPLWNCGDGWDWRAPDELCCWQAETVSFSVWNGEWEVLDPLEVYPETGRVAFPYCVSSQVRATGVGRTATLATTCEWWRLELIRSVEQQVVLGSDVAQVGFRNHGAVAFAETTVHIEGPVLVKFPLGPGVLAGHGNALPRGNEVQITFDPEGVVYEPA